MENTFKLQINNIAKHATEFWVSDKENIEDWITKMSETCAQNFDSLEEAWVYANVWNNSSSVPLSDIKLLEIDSMGAILNEYEYYQAWEKMKKVKVVIENASFNKAVSSYILSKDVIRNFETNEEIARTHGTNILLSMTPEQSEDLSNSKTVFLLPERLITLFDNKPCNYLNKYASQYDSKGREIF